MHPARPPGAPASVSGLLPQPSGQHRYMRIEHLHSSLRSTHDPSQQPRWPAQSSRMDALPPMPATAGASPSWNL